MNDNFNYEPPIIMSDAEKKSHKKIFSKLGFAFLTYMIISQGLSILLEYALYALNPSLLQNSELLLGIASAIQYVVALPILVYFLRDIPKHTPAVNKIEPKTYFKYVTVAMFVMYFGSYISTILMTYMEAYLGTSPENVVNTVLNNTDILFSALVVGIIGPIAEEFMFRKLFIDRLTPYGEAVAIFFPSLMFGLFHGNLYQFFYAFFLGVMFSYIYIKSGKIIYSIALHIFVNLFCGVLPSALYQMLDYEELVELTLSGTLTEEYINANMLPISLLGAYEIVMLVLVGIGLFKFVRNYRNIQINKGTVKFPKGTASEVIFLNAGTIILIAACVLLMAYNTFAV